MTSFQVHPSLHEVLGEEQTYFEVACIALFATLGTWLIYTSYYFPNIAEGRGLIATIVGFIIVADVLAGCIANFSRGTNNYYASKPKARIVFIISHVHILLIAWLLEGPLIEAGIVWAFTIGFATVVNRFAGSSYQTFIGATVMCVGLLLLPLLQLPNWMAIVSALFMLKVVYSFGVNHYTRFNQST
ncbi:hypothetical protein [Vibrio penaeicida]|uniref:hypothetical protein n=1 Tax=Vibrio penaeicida TaxID=104609 RepID=UPI000CEA0D7E|nr:hypothetical protein [Vibrio penaeicida]